MENSKSLFIYKVITGILQCISCVYILSKYFKILTTVLEFVLSDMTWLLTVFFAVSVFLRIANKNVTKKIENPLVNKKV